MHDCSKVVDASTLGSLELSCKGTAWQPAESPVLWKEKISSTSSDTTRRIAVFNSCIKMQKKLSKRCDLDFSNLSDAITFCLIAEL